MRRGQTTRTDTAGASLIAAAVLALGWPCTALSQAGAEAAGHGAHAGHAAAAGGFGDPLEDIVVAFELTDRHGNRVSLEDFRGEYVLLGFGFTHCPDVCPMMALNMGRALRDAGREATGVFVSVDTERDTPAVTDDYAARFGERMVGLGGTIEQINAAAANFKVSYAVTKTQNSYTVQHTANVFVVDPEGRLADVFNFSTPAETLVEAMR